MWGPFCDIFSPDAEKKIELRYRLNSEDSYNTVWFREQSEKDEWLKRNGKYITIRAN